jgi:hypothetical protein
VFVASIQCEARIYPNNPTKSYKDGMNMNRIDYQEWSALDLKEARGFIERKTFQMELGH